MDLISKEWIQKAIRPSDSMTCGNHVAGRKYSSHENKYQVRFHDFIPDTFDQKCSDKSSNYSEYVGCVFEKEKYMEGGTYTAEALRRVRIHDLPMARDGLTYVC